MNIDKISKNILNIRKSNNMSQSECASVLGVTSQAVSKWEHARGIPDIETLMNISKEFNVSLEEIIGGKRIKNQRKN